MFLSIGPCVAVDTGWALWLCCVLYASMPIVLSTARQLTAHQAKRQLRRSPIFGGIATPHAPAVLTVCLNLIAIFGVCLWWWQPVSLVAAIFGIWSLFAAAMIVSSMVYADQKVASDRASLRARAGWLRLRLGDAEGAAKRLCEAQEELLLAVGVQNSRHSWVAAGAHVWALRAAG